MSAGVGAQEVPRSVESAARAMERSEAAVARGRRSFEDEARERGRRLGTLVTPAELAAARGEATAELVVVTWRLSAAGRIEPPIDVVARCPRSAVDGVCRSMDKLLESRGWRAERESRVVAVPAGELGGRKA